MYTETIQRIKELAAELRDCLAKNECPAHVDLEELMDLVDPQPAQPPKSREREIAEKITRISPNGQYIECLLCPGDWFSLFSLRMANDLGTTLAERLEWIRTAMTNAFTPKPKPAESKQTAFVAHDDYLPAITDPIGLIKDEIEACARVADVYNWTAGQKIRERATYLENHVSVQ